MAVEIQILSGARQGERIVLEAEQFRAGAEPDCDVYFDPQLDPPARNRSALLHLTSEGWFIKSIGSGEVLVNQSPVVREDRIRSGDLVRMSELGPDFSFVITSLSGNGPPDPGPSSTAAAATVSEASSGDAGPKEPAENITAGNWGRDFLDSQARATCDPLQERSPHDSGLSARPGGMWIVRVAAGLVVLVLIGMSVAWLVLNRRESTSTVGDHRRSLDLEPAPTQRAAEGPARISVDPTAGQVRSTPPETADGNFEATLQVPDDGKPPLADQTASRVTDRGDPWVRAQKELREALFLVQVELSGPSGRFAWPFATCCAIGDHTLLTTAREVLQMATWQRQGYKIWAICPASGLKTAVIDFRVHPSFPALAQTAGDWVYVNLGLLQTEKPLPKAARLGTAADVRGLEEGLPVGCLGFTHDGSKITRFNRFEPQLHLGKIYLLNAPPRAPSASPPLLELKAKIPENTFGSPILSPKGHVVAVYSEALSSEGVAVKDLHYATSIDVALLDSWLKGNGSHEWLPPLVPKATAASTPASRTEPN